VFLFFVVVGDSESWIYRIHLKNVKLDSIWFAKIWIYRDTMNYH